MRRTSYEAMTCSIAQCLEVVGDWWSLLIVREALVFGETRFDAFHERLGIARSILQRRLVSLSDAGIFAKVAYQQHPPRFDYVLTDKGRDLWPVLMTMLAWGDRHAAPGGAPLEVLDRRCGSATGIEVVCSSCEVPIGPDDVEYRAGPGRPSAAGPVRPRRVRPRADGETASSAADRAK